MTPPALSITSLRFRYPGSAGWALRIDALELAAGEQMLLTGGSGSGKSTLLHLVCGLWEPDEGKITVAGRDIHALRGAARDRFRGATIGMIFQTFNLLHGFTALENVAAALMFSELPRGEHRGRAAALLDHLGVSGHGRDIDKLSIGQQQRVAVARAVAARPALVLADEPTASLDPESAERAMQLIQQTCSENGAALLCVSHDPVMERRFERRAALSELAAAAGAGAAS